MSKMAVGEGFASIAIPQCPGGGSRRISEEQSGLMGAEGPKQGPSDVYRSRTKLPAGLTESELFAAYGVVAVRS